MTSISKSGKLCYETRTGHTNLSQGQPDNQNIPQKHKSLAKTNNVRGHRVRVLFIASCLVRAGPTNQLLYLIRNLPRSTFRPIILTIFEEPKQSLLDQFEKEGIDVQSLNLKKKTTNAYSLLRNAHKAIKIAPDVVHTQGVIADTLGFLLFPTQHLATLRNYPPYDYRDIFGGRKAQVIARLHLTLLSITNVVSCSYAIRKRIEYFNRIRSQVVQNGVETRRFSQTSQQSKKESRQALNLDQDSYYILVSGNLITRKNVETIIVAFKRLNINAHLLIAGGGELRDSLKNRYGCRNIHFLGLVQDIINLYHSADLLVSASRSEGLPNSVLEAMSTGLELLISDIPEHRELLSKHPTPKAFLFHPTDVNDLAKKILAASNRRSKRAGIAFRHIACKHFSAQKMSEKYQNIYLKFRCRQY
ncbi:glycosyltransferase family 4 protein [Pelagicoccus sp. SDUM812002]|uniref:glycosyltransferase family 4 protein n=1 Tax=Pelagicoccus sp. SDUM812002 TaxID=3041266 RepID=UPI0034E25B3C